MSDTNIKNNGDLLVALDDTNAKFLAPKKVDFSKIEDLDELCKVLNHMAFHIHNPEHEKYDDIRHLLKDVEQ